MRLVRRATFVAAATLFFTTLPMQAASGFKLVAHSSVSIRSVDRSAVASIFTKKTLRWPDGSHAVPVDQPVGSDTRESFSQVIHGKGSAVVDAYWQKQVFSGRSLPPLMKGNDAEVVAYVRATPGAIGYVSPGASTSGVNVIDVE